MKKNDKTEKVGFSQHHQLKQLEQIKQQAERALDEIEGKNVSAKESLQQLDDELSALTNMLDDLSIDDLEVLEDINNEEISENKEEIKTTIVSKYNFPKLDTINFNNFESLELSATEYLKIKSFTTEDDPLFLILSATDVKEVLSDYKAKYGDVIPDAYDYGIMGIAGLVGLVCNTFFSNNSKFPGTHNELIKDIGSLILSNTKFKENFIEKIQSLKEHLQSKINLDLSKSIESHPLFSVLFNYLIKKHIDKLHQTNKTELSSDLESQLLNLDKISPSKLLNLCIDDTNTRKIIALIDIKPSEIQEYISTYEFDEIDLSCLIDVIFTNTDIVSKIQEHTGVQNLSEIIDGFLLIYDLVTKKSDFTNDIYNQLQVLISKIIDDSGETMNLKKPIDWLKNQISYDLIQLVNSVYDKFEKINESESVDKQSILILENEFVQKTLIEFLQKEVNEKDFSIYVFGEKIEVFNDLIRNESFLIELVHLLLELKESNVSSTDSNFLDKIQTWSIEKVSFILQHNQILNFKLISDLTIEDFKKLITILNIDFSKIKETGIGYLLVETIIKFWIHIRDNKSISEFKKEPFAVKSSYMLSGAHLLSNTKGFIDLAVSKNPSNINYNTLKMTIQYGFQYYKESLRRDKQLESDFNETINQLYLNSLKF